jgi:hypothetical protein
MLYLCTYMYIGWCITFIFVHMLSDLNIRSREAFIFFLQRIITAHGSDILNIFMPCNTTWMSPKGTLLASVLAFLQLCEQKGAP